MRTTALVLATLAALALPSFAKTSKSDTSSDSSSSSKKEAGPARILHFKILTNAIAITFDDGPDPKNTPRLLEMLKERHIKATFFLIGRSVETYPQIVREIVAQGHEIANHTWDHKDLSRLSDAAALDELQKTHDAIIAACGVTPTLFRPPYGNCKLSQRKWIWEKFHYPAIIWEVDPNDWRKGATSQKVHDAIVNGTKAGSIILCHDIHATTVDAMPSTLDDLIVRGFQFKTISEMIQLEQDERSGKVAPPPLTPTTPTTPPATSTPTTPGTAATTPPAPGAMPPLPPKP